jgi:DNA-binding HxlR family transcriptional regulator
MRLTERDTAVLRELDRWRFALSRQLRFLSGFPSQRTCDRRLKALIDMGYINRKHVLYGVPSLYFPTHKGKALINTSTKPDKFKLEQIHHDIAVIDAAIYFHLHENVPLLAITTEKELHQRDGFGIRRHQPDFTFGVGGKNTCVEVELTPKSKDRLVVNLQDNFMSYDRQVWVVPKAQGKILRLLDSQSSTFPNMEIVPLEDVTDFVKARQAGNSGEVDHAG